MTIIKYLLPSDDHTIKKLLLIFWEIWPKTDQDGKLRPEMILVCDAYRKVYKPYLPFLIVTMSSFSSNSSCRICNTQMNSFVDLLFVFCANYDKPNYLNLSCQPSELVWITDIAMSEETLFLLFTQFIGKCIITEWEMNCPFLYLKSYQFPSTSVSIENLKTLFLMLLN